MKPAATPRMKPAATPRNKSCRHWKCHRQHTSFFCSRPVSSPSRGSSSPPVRLDVYRCSLAPIFITISVLGINPGHSHHTVCGASRSGLSHAPCPPRWNSARCPQRAHWRITLHTNSGAGLIAVGHQRAGTASRSSARERRRAAQA